MKRLALACLALSVTFAAGCQDASLPTFVEDFDPPLVDIVDGAHGDAGNPDFFFLPPLVPNPKNDPDFERGEFNANLSPVVQICDPDLCPDGLVLEEFAKLRHKFYGLRWKTKRSDAGLRLRIRVLVGAKELGFADVQLIAKPKGRHDVPEGIIPVRAGATVPIRFRIENGALCDPPGVEPCASVTVDLGEGATIALNTGDRIDIPAQEGREGEEVTITVQECAEFDNLPIDLPLFGGCFDITADPPLVGEQSLEIPAVFSICTLEATGLSEAQENLVTLHQLDVVEGEEGEEVVVVALPHSVDFCDEPLTSPGALIGIAQARLESMWNGLLAVTGPKPLYARSSLVDRGAGGSIDELGSSFQFALPAKMDFVDPDDAERIAAPGGTLPSMVMVTDRDDNAVQGASVHFTVTEGDGSVSSALVITGEDGKAVVDWTLDTEPGPNALSATGFGIADPLDDGPFMPDISLPTDEQTAVLLETGELVFSATGTNFVVEQGDFTAAVNALDGTQDVVSFYDYDTEFGASANTGLEESNTSILFLYRDEYGIVSLVMIHDKPNDKSGGKAVFGFSGVPENTDFVVRDDNGEESSEAVLPTSTWRWADCCTDGGALSGSLGQAFVITIEPDFPEEGGFTDGKIDAWTFLTGALENPTSIDLALTTAVTIRRLTP